MGEGEPCHTAMERLYPIFINEKTNPTIFDIEEAFSVERVTKEFFESYKEKYFQLKEHLDKNEDFVLEAERLNFTSEQFAKKLMGQLAFLYFIQKKGWLGVNAFPKTMTASEFKKAFFSRGKASRDVMPKAYRQTAEDEYSRIASVIEQLSIDEQEILAASVKGQPWGTGPKNFIRELFKVCHNSGTNFFDDYLEPLFYEALNEKRGANDYYHRLKCRVPFLNGGLFEPIDNYDWNHNDFNIPNEMFSNEHLVGKDDAHGILDIFDRYNFTMNEDEPLEKEVAVDPEMLGKIFENLLDIKDRKSKGAFYTPREIVHYMCQESLINYLVNETGISYDALKDLIVFGEFMKDEDTNHLVKKGVFDMLISKEILDRENGVNRLKEIDEALANIKVADPAVGSGAFPLGMLSEIVKARRNITEYFAILIDNNMQKKMMYECERHPLNLKLHTIKNSIFAVDVEPSAVDITKLRLWLSLVVEQETDENAEDEGIFAISRNPRPLPNLDCNIRCGNSLIDELDGIKLVNESDLLNNGKDEQMVFGQDQFDILLNQLFDVQEKLFYENNHQAKDELKNWLKAIINRIIMYSLQNAKPDTIKHYNKVKDEASLPYFLWTLEFAKVFKEKGGFDVVIGNPPYVGQKGNAKHFEVYKNSSKWRTFYERKQDLYYYFIAQGLLNINKTGQIVYIIPPYFMTASGAKNLRRYILDKSRIYKIVNFSGNMRVFDSANINSIIIFLDKGEKNERIKIIEPEAKETIKNFTQDIKEYLSIYKTSDLNDKEWYIFKNDNTVLLKEANTVPLGLIANISPGIQTGCDRLSDSHIDKYGLAENDYNKDEGIFILTNKEIEIFNKEELSFVKPLYKNSDIQKWNTTSTNQRWILITNEIEDIDRYPNIKQHLQKYRIILDGRYRNFALKNADKEGKWWFLYGYRPNTNFNGEKIVNANRASSNIFSYSDTPFYATMDIFFTVVKNTDFMVKYVLAIMNSKLIKYWLSINCKLKGSMLELIAEPLAMIPIKRLTKEKQVDFVKLVDSIILLLRENPESSDIAIIERQIDEMVYKLYGITDEEIKIVEGV